MKEYFEYCVILGTSHGTGQGIIDPKYAITIGFLTPDESRNLLEKTALMAKEIDLQWLGRDECQESQFRAFLVKRDDFNTRLEIDCRNLFARSDEFDEYGTVDGHAIDDEKTFYKYTFLLRVRDSANQLRCKRSGLLSGVLHIDKTPGQSKSEIECRFTDYFPAGWEPEMEVKIDSRTGPGGEVHFTDDHRERVMDLIEDIAEKYEEFVLSSNYLDPSDGPFSIKTIRWDCWAKHGEFRQGFTVLFETEYECSTPKWRLSLDFVPDPVPSPEESEMKERSATADVGPGPVVKKAKPVVQKTKTVAARLENLINKYPHLSDCTADQLSDKLKCSRSSIVATDTWKKIMRTRVIPQTNSWENPDFIPDHSTVSSDQN